MSEEYQTLYHHGIKGMRWGIRRFQDKNGRLTAMGKKRYADDETERGEQKSGLSDRQKKALKIGAAAVATTLAAYGTYRLVKSGKLDKYVNAGKNKIDELLGNRKAGNSQFGNQKVNDLFKQATQQKTAQTVNGLKKLAKPETLSETLRNVNNHKGSIRDYSNNCTLCSIATFLRQQGIDVKSGSTGGQMQQLGEKVEECFKGAKIFEGSAVKFGRSRQDAAEMLMSKFGNNASGVCSVQWKNGGGHAFNWKIKDGVVSFFDGQTNRDDSIVSKYWRFINPNGGLTLARLDGVEINIDGVKKILE